MSASVEPLVIAVVGAGKIGSTFAFKLARDGGHDVTVVARPGSRRLHQLDRDGGILDVAGRHAAVRVLSEFDVDTPYDLVIVTLLAQQAGALLPSFARSAAKDFQFMFNTFHPELLQEATGVARSSFGMPFVQAMFDADGRLRATIGAGGQKTIMSRQRWVDLFNAAGLPAALEPDMPSWLRSHVPLCVAFEAVSIAGERRGGGASWRDALRLARGVHASFTLLNRLGYRVHPRSKRIIASCPDWTVASMLWSMSRVRSFRELLATGETECRALVDTMASAASFARPPVATSAIQAMRP